MSDNDYSTDEQKTGKLSKSKSTKLIIAVIVFILLFIVVTGALVVSSRLAISFKSPDDVVILSKNVCDNEFVSNYNKIMSKQFDIDEKADYKEKIDDLLNKARSKKGYENDPTCQYVEYRSNLLYNRDYASAKKNVESIKNHAVNGIYVDTRIHNLSSVDSMIESVDYYVLDQEKGSTD